LGLLAQPLGLESSVIESFEVVGACTHNVVMLDTEPDKQPIMVLSECNPFVADS
jgi:hypothetical protein